MFERFDHVFIYENDWYCDLTSPFITKIRLDGNKKQLIAYNNFIEGYKKDYDYAAFFDCDEFLVLKKHKNIQEFVEEYDNPIGIGINWVLYGSMGKIKREINSQLKMFIRRENKINEHIKTILNLSSNCKMVLPHNPNGSVIDTNKKKFRGPFNVGGTDEVAIINHYYYKTKEDWIIKCKRGRADAIESINENIWDKNKKKCADIEDTAARDWFYGK